ncbi:MAG: hypothetical protein JSW48_05550 [Betaproteobacteria bacterium]|nr:MAG: hypothetical protein JSW48_05550 [Betaproteobacteria bacterium]
MVQRALTIYGSNVGTAEELRRVVALARASKLRRIPIEQRLLSEVNRTLDQLETGKIVSRVVADLTVPSLVDDFQSRRSAPQSPR